MTTLVPYRGPSYIALRYAAMRRDRPFSEEDVYKVFGHKFEHKYMVGRSMKRLANIGLVKTEQDKWVITDKGRQYLRDTAEEYYGEK